MRQPFQRPVLRYRAAAAASGMVDGYDNVPQTLDGGLAEHGAAAHGRRGTVSAAMLSARFLQAQCPGNKLK